tara:strand:- start:466 stop:756 length:291 start_codon:yes stop_codon:yes gene_type:complete
MVQRKGGFRRKTRSKLSKSPKEKGRVNINAFFQEFKAGEKVCFKADPSYQKAMYFPRFHGKAGIIKSKEGSCYQVAFKDKNKQKIAVVHPIHLKKL